MNIDPDALRRNDEPGDEDIHTGLPWNHVARLDGLPGMVWYSCVRKVPGGRLKVGDWLDSLDHRGARMICAIHSGRSGTRRMGRLPRTLTRRREANGDLLTVVFSFGDSETARRDVEYDVVDPASQVTPDGTPVVDDWPEMEETAF